MFEKASRIKLRYSTNRGVLSVEDLWDLSLEQLDPIAQDAELESKSYEELAKELEALS